MAITFPASARATVASGTLTISQPSGLEDGDYLLFEAARDDDVSEATYDTGFIEIARKLEASGDDRSGYIAQKYISDAASEAATYSFSWASDSGEPAVGSLVIVRGADPAAFLDVAYVEGTHYLTQNSSSGPDGASITTNTNGAVVVVFAFGTNFDGTTDPDVSSATRPTGYTALGGVSGGGWDRSGTGSREAQWLSSYKTVATAGAEDPAAYTGFANSSNDYGIFTFAIKPIADTGVLATRHILALTANTATIAGSKNVVATTDAFTVTENAATISLFIPSEASEYLLEDGTGGLLLETGDAYLLESVSIPDPPLGASTGTFIRRINRNAPKQRKACTGIYLRATARLK